jgi:hypothetical protein
MQMENLKFIEKKTCGNEELNSHPPVARLGLIYRAKGQVKIG